MPVPLRVLALLIVVSALALATLAPALADMHPAAADGQRLEDQPPAVQALYNAVYGDDAAAMWIAEHNAAIGASAAPAAAPAQSSYYDRIVAVAMARGADADLANRIAVDVIGRGTEAAFLAGTDTGVLYGVGTSETDINAAPAAAPASSSGGGGGGTAAPTKGTGIFLGVSQANITLQAGVNIGVSPNDAITLPTTSVLHTGYAESQYSIAGLPPGLTFTPDSRVISSQTNTLGKFTVTYTATQADADTGADPVLETKTASLSFVIEVVSDLSPSFGTVKNGDLNLSAQADSGTHTITLPEATGANGDLSYALTRSDTNADWLKYDDDSKKLSGKAPEAAHGATTFTWTATDDDGTTDTNDDDATPLTFTVTITADTSPSWDSAPTVGTAIVGVDYNSGAITAASNGEGDLTYSVSGLPGGLSFDAANRIIYGVPTALPDNITSRTHDVVLTATDEDGDKGSTTISLVVNATAGG